MPFIDHDQQRNMLAILSFIIPALLNFITVKYQGSSHSPFETHPIIMFFSIFTLLFYCSLSLSLVAYLPTFTTTYGDCIFRFLMILSFCLSIALPTLLLFPSLSFFLPYLLLLILLFAAHLCGLIQKLIRLVREKIIVFVFVHLFCLQLLRGRAPSILPRTVADTHFMLEL
ncbi:hypothetical protein ACJRO7_028144 [Eucalyptus globulus]|uniref:Uncharacterized protein n=1 Tax=Eucalyptus globulus TaxID=34317 RepID=A0ABD3JW36_EUCGL